MAETTMGMNIKFPTISAAINRRLFKPLVISAAGTCKKVTKSKIGKTDSTADSPR